jgi:type VI secretion system protein ImpE
MNVSELLTAGRLGDAIDAQQAVLAESPGNSAARLLMADLWALAGDYTTAWVLIRQIDDDSPAWKRTRRHTRGLLQSLLHRLNGRRPQLIGPAPEHVRNRLRLRRAHRDEDGIAARKFLDRADRASPMLTGHVDGREFSGFRDADDRTASVLEVILNGHYAWIEFEAITRIVLAPARHLLDIIIREATLTLRSGDVITGHLPVRGDAYFELPNDDALALGLDTEWHEDYGDVVETRGAKIILTTAEEIELAQCRQIDLRLE